MNSETYIPKRNLKFGIVGPFQAGKSLLINCLLARPIATVGDGTATTHAIVTYLYSNSEEFIEYYVLNQWQKLSVDEFNRIDTAINLSEVKVYLKHDLLKHYTIIDIPGLGNDYVDNSKAKDAIKKLDYAILLTNNEKVMTEKSDDYESFLLLKRYNIPYYFILNCTASKKWYANTESNRSIYEKNNNLFKSFKSIVYPFQENEPIIVNLIWYWLYSQGRDSITSKYDYLLNKYGLYKPDLDPLDIKLHSNFLLLEKIFSMDNRMYLELKKELKEELSKLKEELCPVGTIQAFAYNKVPQGWMICDGAKLDPTVHHELFNAIGTTFGGDGKNYFRLPDLRGRFIRGWDSIGNNDNEREFGTYQDDALQMHSHLFDANKLHISKGGRHNHPLWCNEYDTVYSILSITQEKAKRMCYPSNSGGSGMTDLAPYSGEHNHTISIVESPITDPTNIGSNIVKTCTENRPKNCALLFCIKTDPYVEGGIIPENDFILINDLNDEPEIPCNSELSYKELISRL